MGKIEAVIFDWAGTTVDYGCFAPVQVFIEIFQHVGIEPTMEEVRKPMGMLKRDHIKTMLGMERIHGLWLAKYQREYTEEDIDGMYEMYEKKLLNILEQYADPKPYVPETVAKLREMGIKIGSTTGYNDKMMEIITKKAEKNGYKPDVWFSPNAVGNVGRPYPYMIFKNMEVLGCSKVQSVIKIGDTVSDIKEGKNAGVISVGVLEGSSEMALTEAEYEALSEIEKEEQLIKSAKKFQIAGSDYIIRNISELPNLIEQVSQRRRL